MKTAVIGFGNMANALLAGMLRNKAVKADEVTVSDVRKEALERAAEVYGVHTAFSNEECVKDAKVVLLSVKPGMLPAVAPVLRGAVPKDAVILSILAGRTLADLEEALGEGRKIVRCMPNTPALVGEGIIGYCPNGNVTKKELAMVKRLLESCSEAEQLTEPLIKVISSLSGSSPAYVYMMIEAMADAGVAEGMPRDAAMHFAAKTVQGSAKMVLETGLHPGALKDMVCSPGGSTIEGVAVLEEMGFRSAVIEAVRAATRKLDSM